MALRDGQRVYWQRWDDGPGAAALQDRGTVVAAHSAAALVVVWDLDGSVDPVSSGGMARDWPYRARSLGDVPDVAPEVAT